jgi:hypothetical protein
MTTTAVQKAQIARPPAHKTDLRFHIPPPPCADGSILAVRAIESVLSEYKSFLATGLGKVHKDWADHNRLEGSASSGNPPKRCEKVRAVLERAATVRLRPG